MHHRTTRSIRSIKGRQAERGVALVVALILLVVMTLLGLGSMRSVTLEEKMSANTFDRSISFQAAEATLRQAEALLNVVPPASPPTPAAGICANGICGEPVAGAEPRWTDTSFTGWQNATTVTSGPISITPQYLIEYLGGSFICSNTAPIVFSCKRYRVTVRSNAGADRAAVVLQTIYATQ
jgi:type IV pilus assembly protein PilX